MKAGRKNQKLIDNLVSHNHNKIIDKVQAKIVSSRLIFQDTKWVEDNLKILKDRKKNLKRTKIRRGREEKWNKYHMIEILLQIRSYLKNNNKIKGKLNKFQN